MSSLRLSLGGRAVRAAAVLGMALVAWLSTGEAASAHVRVFAEGAEQEKPATLRFRVPSEKADVTTVRVDVGLPPGVTVNAAARPAGWTETARREGSAFHVVWTALSGQEITPDEHRYFDVEVGPLPDSPSLTFDVVQTYSDGTVVNWNQRPVGKEEPAFPAPVLVLDAGSAAAAQDGHRALPAPTKGHEDTSASMVTAGREDAATVSWPAWTVAAISVCGALATALWRRRRPKNSTRSPSR